MTEMNATRQPGALIDIGSRSELLVDDYESHFILMFHENWTSQEINAAIVIFQRVAAACAAA